jgi:cytochrome P450
MAPPTQPIDVEPFDPDELQDTLLSDVEDVWTPLGAAFERGPVIVGHAIDANMDLEVEMPVDQPESITVLGYDEAAQVLNDDETFSSAIYADIMGIVMGHSMLEMDGDEHTLHRALVSQAFRRKVLARWESDLVEVVVDELIDRFAERGRADLVRELTFAFPVQVIARILGLPREEYPIFQRKSLELLSVVVNWERGMAASQWLRDYFAGILEQRRREPADDLISDLAVTELDGQRLSDDAIFAFLRLMLPAGVETTYRSSGNLLYALLNHPDQLEAVRNDRTLIHTAIEEGLRWEPPITFVVRKAIRDTELGGLSIKAGTSISICVAQANRDPRRYSDPDKFDLFRQSRLHVTFGHGVHICLGMHLARMETRVAINRVLDRLPNLRLDPDAAAPIIQGVAFRSPNSLPVVFG